MYEEWWQTRKTVTENNRLGYKNVWVVLYDPGTTDNKNETIDIPSQGLILKLHLILSINRYLEYEHYYYPTIIAYFQLERVGGKGPWEMKVQSSKPKCKLFDRWQ